MVSKLSITVEVLAGTDLITALEEAKDLARRMDLAYVDFNFNGVSFSVSQGADTTKLYYQYNQNEDNLKYGVVG